MPPKEDSAPSGSGNGNDLSRPQGPTNSPAPSVVVGSLSRPLGSIRPQGVPTTSSRGIGNTAVQPSGMTRTGVPRMTFQPFNPMRRKVEPTLVPEALAPGQDTVTRSRGRGRGRGDGDPPGRGRGRGEVTMVASGPFAMGPAASGSSSSFRRTGESFTPTGLGANHISTPSSSTLVEGNRRYDQNWDNSDGDLEIFEEDGGEQKVDMRHVQRLDWSAPVALKPKSEDKPLKKSKRESKVKEEDVAYSRRPLGVPIQAQPEPGGDSAEAREMANALDLSESEEEEDDEEDIMRHFTRRHLAREAIDAADTEKLYFFQFPAPFPTFVSPTDSAIDVDAPDHVDSMQSSSTDAKQGKSKAVSWAPGVKAEGDNVKGDKRSGGSKRKPSAEIDGIIGRMEIYENGEVKIRLGEGVLMTVKAATPISFLQQAVEIDVAGGRMNALGQVSRKFIVQPDIQALLDELNGITVDVPKLEPGLEGLEAMDSD
ncbi:hypothetical protein FRB94_008738 [Tulasnella sp. JGI-2019a]|nr:hypothetical protein FRB94_008738 [Tulasnella sp. JGI-2019a]